MLNFDGSQMGCGKATANILVPSGRVAFQGGKVDFKVNAKEFDLKPVSYFARLPVEGVADLSGRIISEPKGVVFESSAQGKNLVFFEVGPATFGTQIRIDDDGLVLSGVSLRPENNLAQDLRLSSRRVFISFSDRVPSSFHLAGQGDLKRIRHLAPGVPSLMWFAGDAQHLDLTWDMDLSTAEVSALDGLVRVDDFRVGPLSGRQLSAQFACARFLCSKSQIVLHQPRWGESEVSQRVPSNPARLALNLEDISPKSFAASLDVVGLSFGRDAPPGGSNDVSDAQETKDSLSDDWNGVWNASLRLAGPFTHGVPGVSGQIRLRDVTRQGSQLGSLVVQVATTGGHGRGEVQQAQVETRKVTMAFDGAFEQVSGELSFLMDPSAPMTGFVNLKSFDVMPFFSRSRAKHNLYSEVSGRVDLNSPSPLLKGAFVTEAWQNGVRARARLTRTLWSAGGVRAEVSSPLNIVWQGKQLTIDAFEVRSAGAPTLEHTKPETSAQQVGGSTRLNGQVRYDTASGQGLAKIAGRLDLALLQGILPMVETFRGHLDMDALIRIQGGIPAMKGTLALAAQQLSIHGLEPAFEGLSGRAELTDDRIEITSLTGNKGQGQFEILGSVRLPFKESSEGQWGLGLRARLTRLQSRLAAPVFRSVDATVSGSLELSGESQPYALSGQIVVDRLRAFRDLDCDGVIEALPKGSSERLRSESHPWFSLNILFEAQETIQVLTQCVRSNISSRLRLTGSEWAPRFAGSLTAESGLVQVLKARFSIQKADIIFDSPIAFDPRLDIQLVAPVENYQVFLNIDGYSSAPRTSFWSDPSTTPWGAPVGQAEILRMVATGRAPRADSAQGNVLASQVANYVYGSTALDESLSKALARITAGLVDTVQLQPFIEDGQTAWKATLSRSLGDRFNLGLDVEQSPIANNQSLTGTLHLNQSVNILGGFDRKSSPVESYYELSGGFRFLFGGK
jgi:hypothetical protein